MRSLEFRTEAIPPGRLDAITELRGLAMLLVILYHAGGVLVMGNNLHGDLGVDIFVILSGVGLALSRKSTEPRAFLRRRLLTLLPAYWVVLTVYLWGNHHFLQLDYSAWDIVVHYLGIHAWFGDFIGLGVNDSFWFITLLLDLYIIYLAFRRFLGRPDVLILAGGLVSVAVAFAYFFTGQSGCFGHIGMRIPGFFVGLLIGSLLREGRLSIPLTPTLGVGLVLFTYVPYTQGIIFYSAAVAAALAIGYLLSWKARVSQAWVNSSGRVLRFLGTYSLEIFLIHQPLIRSYNYYLQGRWFHEAQPSAYSLIVGMIIGLIVALIVAVELHKLIGRLGLGGRDPAPAQTPNP